jgi:hypothetical protein
LKWETINFYEKLKLMLYFPKLCVPSFNFQAIFRMNEPYVYDLEFISVRIVNLKTPHVVIMEVQRAVEFIHDEPDWDHLDDVVCTFLDSNHIEEYKRLPTPCPHPAGGWLTHSFDMGCPRLIWIFPESVRRGGS